MSVQILNVYFCNSENSAILCKGPIRSMFFHLGPKLESTESKASEKSAVGCGLELRNGSWFGSA